MEEGTAGSRGARALRSRNHREESFWPAARISGRIVLMLLQGYWAARLGASARAG